MIYITDFQYLCSFSKIYQKLYFRFKPILKRQVKLKSCKSKDLRDFFFCGFRLWISFVDARYAICVCGFTNQYLV